MRAGIMAGGDGVVDHVKTIDVWPPQDSLATILHETQGNGGGPYNVLKNLARLAARFPLEAVGLVGDDASGRAIAEDCRVHGIDTTQLRVTDAAPTSHTDVMTVADTRPRTFFHQRGANALLAPEHSIFRRRARSGFTLGICCCSTSSMRSAARASRGRWRCFGGRGRRGWRRHSIA